MLTSGFSQFESASDRAKTRLFRWSLTLIVAVLYLCAAAAQTAVVTRNVILRSMRSTNGARISRLTPGIQLKLLEQAPVQGYYRVQTIDGSTGFVWAKNLQVNTSGVATEPGGQHTTGPTTSTTPTTTTTGLGGPVPLVANQHPVDWWFVFKFNSGVFPGCGTATRTCPFGGDVQAYRNFSQQFVYASSENKTLQQGNDCLGDSSDDPVGATFAEAYNGSFYYVVWNDQYYGDPQVQGCGNSCSAPWGHSKGMVVWNDSGQGFVLQVTTPSWPASGSQQFPRTTDGNTLGCIKDDNVQVSQHFFALRLTKDDLTKVLAALKNASVVTDPQNQQIVKNGGPADIQELVKGLGTKSKSATYSKDLLSTGVQLISKPSGLLVPPWQMVSAVLGGISLRTATWWANPEIYTTTTSTQIPCWDNSLGKPGAVEIATTGHWAGKEIGLTGGLGVNFNHAKIGVSTSGDQHYSIFGDMNQQGTISGPNCGSSQNGRGGLFYVVSDTELSGSITNLISGNTAPQGP